MHFSTLKKNLLLWSFWFAVGNIILFLIIALNYLPTISWFNSFYIGPHNKIVLAIYVFTSYVGHLSIIAFLPWFILVPIILFFPRKNFIFFLWTFVSTLLGMMLALDVFIYKMYHFHLQNTIIKLILHSLREEVFGLSRQEYWQSLGAFVGLFIIEWGFAIFLWRFWIRQEKSRSLIKWLVIFLSLNLYLSYTMIISSYGYGLNRIFIDAGQSLPFYTDVLATLLPMKNAQSKLEDIAQPYLVQSKKIDATLNYPLIDLQYQPTKHPKNLVIIVIDTWRFDMLNTAITPNLSQFATQSWLFTRHFSGGNSTGPGIFSLFYGLPASYWTAMESQQRGPVLINEIIKQHYEMGIFSSAELSRPPLNRTVFQAIATLNATEQPAKNPYERDKMVTQKFIQFVTHIASQKKPFFSFVFYDSAHSYCGFENDLLPLQPSIKECSRAMLSNDTDPVPYFNRYKNALMLVDQEVAQDLYALRMNHLLDNTVVIITGDHGEEFNDNHLGYWGHAGNFTAFQVQTPLIVYWPGSHPKVFNYQTSHFDIVPTLLERLWGCQTPSEKYSVGTNLLNPHPRPYLIIGSYVSLGILEADRITPISPTGHFSSQQLNGNPSVSPIHLSVLQQVLQDLRRFYR